MTRSKSQGGMVSPGHWRYRGRATRRDVAQALQVHYRHLDLDRLQHSVGQIVVAREPTLHAVAPRRQATTRVHLERRFPTVQTRRDVVPDKIEQRGALLRRVPTATKAALQLLRHARVCEVNV